MKEWERERKDPLSNERGTGQERYLKPHRKESAVSGRHLHRLRGHFPGSTAQHTSPAKNNGEAPPCSGHGHAGEKAGSRKKGTTRWFSWKQIPGPEVSAQSNALKGSLQHVRSLGMDFLNPEGS